MLDPGPFGLLLALVAPPPVAVDFPQIELRGSLRVAAVAGSPQFVTFPPASTDGRADGASGVDVELLRRFAALHRLKLELVGADSWEHLLPMLDADRADVAAGGVTDTAGRREQADFTAEVFPTRLVIVTRKPHRVVASVAELRNERVGTVRGSSMAEAIRAAGIPASAIDDSIASDGLVEALQSGRVSACVIGVTGALLARKRDPALQIGGWVGPPRALAWAVRKGAPQLRARLDEFLANIRRSGAWSELVVRYFGESALPILRAAREP